MRVLCLDIEGGQGGSSRSLYYSIKELPAGQVECEVWHRKEGPIQKLYQVIDVPVRHEPRLRSIGAMVNLRNSAYDFINGALKLLTSERHLLDLLTQTIHAKFDLVHFNHEGLWILAYLLRSRVDVPFTMHVRKVLPINIFARIQVSVINKSIDHLVFISASEKDSFLKLGCKVSSSIIHNIVEPLGENVIPHPGVPKDSRFKVLSNANYSWNRGVDRIIDVACVLKSWSCKDIIFVFTGNLKLPASLPGQLGEIGQSGGGVEDLARERGVSDMCVFLGHVEQPERVIIECQVLFKAARKDFPWGRDILEAMRAGRPVLTTGTVSTFVETSKTGVLLETFDVEVAARCIVDWAKNRQEVDRLGRNACARVSALCDGPARAADLLNVWRSVRRI